jgi:uncharacterized protein (DUF1501 family)
MTRRQFLQSAAGAGAAGAIGFAIAKEPWQRHHTEKATGAPVTRGPGGVRTGILVLLTLYGGNDGLNTVIPFEDARYLDARRNLGHVDGNVLPLAEGLALNPALTGLKQLWDKRRLAIVRGVGYPQPNRSHFVSMDIWQSGSTSGDHATGWLGRWLDATGRDPLRAISVGATVPRALKGQSASATSVPVGPFKVPGSPKLEAAFTTMQQPDRYKSPLAAAVARSGSDLLVASRTIAEVVAQQPESRAETTDGGSYAGQLGEQLSLVARLIKADLPTRVYSVGLGGFDTHANENAVHTQLLRDLDSSLTRFFADIGAHPHGDDVVVVAYSEFGRRVEPNASGGTDHGTAAPVFVMGPHVKGGTFYGDEPSLVDLDDGDLKLTTDFRSVYATILEGVVGFDPRATLDRSYPRLDLLD